MDASVTIPQSSSGVALAGVAPSVLPPRRFAAWLGLLIVLSHLEIVLGTHSFFYRDYTLFGYSLAHHLKDSFWQGELPLWNPLNNCGLPYLAQWNTMVLYPPSIFYVLLPLPWSLAVFQLAHLFLAGMGMYFLARRWTGNELAAGVAGFGFAFSGLVLHCLMWPNNIAALGWMPWVVWLVEAGWSQGRRKLVPGVVVAALQVTAGAPEIIAFTWLILGAMFAGRICAISGGRPERVARFGLTMVLVGGLTAAQMLPFLDLVFHSQRHRNFGGDVWAMPAWGWANLLVPMFHCTPSRIGVFGQDTQQWTSSYYMGIGLLGLALVGALFVRRRLVWFLAAAAFCGLVLALGANGFVYDALKRVLPLLGFIRFPIKFVILTVFAVPLLAAIGLDWIQCRAAEEPAMVRRKLAVLGALLFAGLAVTVWVSFHAPVENESGSRTAGNGLSRAVFLLTVFLLAWMTARVQKWRPWPGLALLLAVGMDGLTHMPRQNPIVPSSVFEPMRLAMSAIPRIGEARAMINPVTQAFLENASPNDPEEIVRGHRRSLFSNCNLIEGVPKQGGFFSLYLKEESEVRALFNRATNSLLAPLADFLAVGQISSDAELFGWTSRAGALPWITVGQTPLFAGDDETLRGIGSTGFNPQHTVFLPPEARSFLSSVASASSSVISSRVTPHRVEAEIEAASPTLLVIAQCFYHPWKARVDDKPVRLWRANHAFQALEVPSGRHRITVTYEDWMFRIGALVSLATLLALTVGWFHAGSRQGLKSFAGGGRS